MQDAQFGPILLGNDFKLNNNVLVGISSESVYSIGSVIDKFSHPEKINFDGVLIDQIKDRKKKPDKDLASGNGRDNPDLNNKTDEVLNFFRDRELNFKICEQCSSDSTYLRDRSALYDLFCVGEEVFKKENNDLLKYFYKLRCPVMIVPGKFNPPQHILFVFDGTPESIIGVKKFIQLFSSKIMETTVTSLIINDNLKNDKGFNEKVIVDYLLSNFIDVGIVVTTCDSVNRDLERLLSQYPGSIILSGLSGLRTMISRNFCNLLSSNHIPVFFSN